MQEFNLFMNSVYKAVGTTMDLISKYVGLASGATFTGFAIGDMAHRSTDHEPESAFDYVRHILLFFSSHTCGPADQLCATIYGHSGPSLHSTSVNARHRCSRASLTRSARHLTKALPSRHQSVADLLAHGAFLSPALRNLPEIEAALKDVTQIRALVILLRSMNAFVTRGSEPCSGRGPNGAWEEQDHLSFCGPDNVLMNIVLARGDKVENTIYNAQTIGMKYPERNQKSGIIVACRKLGNLKI
ncbi:hypothetical protein KEM48_005954 [Puccinia striiformis f. sp. tritici PST-130]|nr:hypothetical protein KEM48_005954 [Puccinia striiformis f. sp. tritici PST-130]